MRGSAAQGDGHGRPLVSAEFGSFGSSAAGQLLSTGDDEHSWLSTDEWGPKKGRGPHLPLLFDESYRKKPAHDGVVRALSGR